MHILSASFPLHQHFERPAHHFGVEKLLDRGASIVERKGKLTTTP
jgi:hypothetical protein